ncbi:DUF1367 family protein [Candidatus Pacearchaeota archaeon]|nr:DUF1367 family protein [Candidatus Pacearchaeota archaeon]
MKITLEKRQQGLFPLHDSDKEALILIDNGSTFYHDFKLLRNPKFHIKVFSFLNLVFKYQDDYLDFDRFRDRITFLSGYYREIVIFETDVKTIVKVEVDSWSWENMKELEFRNLFKRVKDVCWRHYVPRMTDRENIERQLMKYD